jgi:iron-sulfur cluster assembly accessory protein
MANSSIKPVITLTDNAQRHFEQILAAQPNATAIRLGVKISGCSGKSYVLLPAETRLPQEITIHSGSLEICVDPSQLPSLQGLEIDCVQDGLNQRIVFNNPNAKGTCGCGESFTD